MSENKNFAKIVDWFRSIHIKSIPYYIIAFVASFSILSLIWFMYQLGFGRLVPGFLSVSKNLCSGAATACFLYYLRHTKALKIPEYWGQLAFSAAYGLSSYAININKSILVFAVFAIFPLVFLTFEKMAAGSNYFPFIIACAIMLWLSPSAGLPIFLLLLVLSVIELFIQKRLHLGEFLHILACFLLVLALAAGRIVFYLAPMFAERGDYIYEGFAFRYDPAIFLSRLLPGSFSSLAYATGTNRMDFYFGLGCLLCFLLFFFQNRISARKRACYFAFTLLIIAVMDISPIQFVFYLFCNPDHVKLAYTFFLVFWALRLAAESIHTWGQTGMAPKFLAALSLLAICAISYIWSGHIFQDWIFSVIAILTAIYLLLLVLSASKRRGKTVSRIFYGLLFVELIFNAVSISNMDALPASREMSAINRLQSADAEQKEAEKSKNPENINIEEASKIEETAKNEETKTKKSAGRDKDNGAAKTTEDAYNQFLNDTEDAETNTILNQLDETVSLEFEEYEQYTGKLFPDTFESLNAKCHKLGIQEDLFIESPVTIQINAPADYSCNSLGNSLYSITYLGSQYNETDYLPYTLSAAEDGSQNIYILNSTDGILQKPTSAMLKGKQDCYLPVFRYSNYSSNVQILAYALNTNTLKQLPPKLKALTKEKDAKKSLLVYDYIGIGVSYLALMFLFVLLFYNDKEVIYAKLYHCKDKLAGLSLPGKLYQKIADNRVYLLAFAIPFLLMFSILLATDCAPFGKNTIFDEDGTAIELPHYMDYYYNQQEGNQYLNMNSNFGINIYPQVLCMAAYSWLRLLPSAASLPLALQTIVILLISFCGVSMVYYMTHRVSARAADKRDIRLLVPALIYSLNAFMLISHTYINWFYSLAVFPLLILAWEYMIYKKKTLPYIVLLAFSILNYVLMGFYICVFLVILFFLIPFRNVRDFFHKGIRFAICSLLAAANSFLAIFIVRHSYNSLSYAETDSALPVPGLHGSFLHQWKSFMPCTPAQAISTHDGDIYLYCGVLTLILALAYFLSKHIRISEKIRMLVPIVFLGISMNEQVLSYFWNAMHYQSKVPNRYNFLLMFLIAITAYEGLKQISKITVRKYLFMAALTIAFFALCQFAGDGNTMPAFCLGLGFVLAYALLHFRYRAHRRTFRCRPILLSLFVLEIAINTIFTGVNWGYLSLGFRGDFVEQSKLFNETLAEDGQYYRCIYPAYWTSNMGALANTDSPAAFSPYLSRYSHRTASAYGYDSGGNITRVNSANEPYGNAMSCIKYLFVHPLTQYSLSDDLKQYRYLGYYNGYYIYENPYPLSLGIYTPEQTLRKPKEEMEEINAFRFYIHHAGIYLDTRSTLLEGQVLTHSDDPQAENSYYFTDQEGKQLSFEEFSKIFAREREEDDNSLIMHINVTAPRDGYAYIAENDAIGLGAVKAGESYSLHIRCPKSFNNLPKSITLLVANQEAFEQFYAEVSKNQLEDISIQNDTITGTTDYEQDGYTMLSLAYDPSWHAYIDGKEVDIENPYDAMMFVKTPAGKHKLELKLIPYGKKFAQTVTHTFWVLTLLGHLAIYLWKRRKA